MSALFGKSTNGEEKTLLLIDVENGSVASALARVSKNAPPRLFGEQRISLPILHPVSSEALARNIDKAVDEALFHTSEVAARLRNNEKTSNIGQISAARIFLSAPWVGATHNEKGLRWGYEPEMLSQLQKSAASVTDSSTVLVHPFSKAAASAAYAFSPEETLLCIVTGEVIELIVAEDGIAKSRATIPFGLHTVLRTLQSHAGLSFQEAHSALRLSHDDAAHPYHEPLLTAEGHFAEEFVDSAQELLETNGIQTVLILAPEPVGEWFAKALTNHKSTVSLFPHGGVVRALRTKHCMQYIAAHAPTPDLHLMLETMFISTAHASGNSGI